MRCGHCDGPIITRSKDEAPMHCGFCKRVLCMRCTALAQKDWKCARLEHKLTRAAHREAFHAAVGTLR